MLRSRVTMVLLLLTAAITFAAPAQDYEKKILKQFPISNDGEVEILNKYGKLEVETWSEQEVKIEVTIKVDAKNQDKANEIFERISVDFSNTSSMVRASTDVNSTKNWSKWFSNNSNRFEINYKVFLPASVDVDLSNKYGDIFLASMDGDVEIDLKYGNLRMDAAEGDINLSLGYGKGSISSGGNLVLDLKYSTLHCGDLGDISANTKYSTFEMGNVGSIQSTSAYDAYRVKSATTISNVGKYDDISVEQLDAITMTTKYSHLVIGSLAQSADLNFRHGGIKISNLKTGFSKIDIVGDYTGISIVAEASAVFDMDVSGRYTSMKHSNMEVYHDVQSTSQSDLKGYRGGRDQGGDITAKLNYGSFKIN